MALDDAIEKARREADQREEEERERRTRQRPPRLGADSTKRLAPYLGRESLHVPRRSATGKPRGPHGQRYHQAGALWG